MGRIAEILKGVANLFCCSCSPSLSGVSGTLARRGHRTSLGDQGPCMSLYCRSKVRHYHTAYRTEIWESIGELFSSPSPPLAFLIGNGNVETLVVGVDERPVEESQGSDQREALEVERLV